MRRRDLAILLLSAFAIFFSLQVLADPHLSKHLDRLCLFFLSITSLFLCAPFTARGRFFLQGGMVPPLRRVPHQVPIRAATPTDLNGDGKSEVLVATHDAKIQVLEPHRRRVDECFIEARMLAEVSLLPDKVHISSGRRPVAMAVGFVDRIYKHKHREIREKVLVVVTSGWSVMCFDHNLKKLWENNLQEDFPHGAHHRLLGEMVLSSVSGSMEVLKPCWAVATSGVPVREQLFNASICYHTHFNLFQHGDFARSFGRTIDVGSLKVATPFLVHRGDGHKHQKGSHGDVVFLTNQGEVTSYSPSLHNQGSFQLVRLGQIFLLHQE